MTDLRISYQSIELLPPLSLYYHYWVSVLTYCWLKPSPGCAYDKTEVCTMMSGLTTPGSLCFQVVGQSGLLVVSVVTT